MVSELRSRGVALEEYNVPGLNLPDSRTQRSFTRIRYQVDS
jgi:hypothetical protein